MPVRPLQSALLLVLILLIRTPAVASICYSNCATPHWSLNVEAGTTWGAASDQDQTEFARQFEPGAALSLTRVLTPNLALEFGVTYSTIRFEVDETVVRYPRLTLPLRLSLDLRARGALMLGYYWGYSPGLLTTTLDDSTTSHAFGDFNLRPGDSGLDVALLWGDLTGRRALFARLNYQHGLTSVATDSTITLKSLSATVGFRLGARRPPVP